MIPETYSMLYANARGVSRVYQMSLSDITVFENLTLDGVMQAPGRRDEDLRGGFRHGGWATPYADPVLGRVAGEGMANTGGLLLGRRTYEDLYAVWPNRTDNPFTEVLNNTQTLMQYDLIDQYQLLVYPVVLGSGKRLFKNGSKATLKLVETKSFSSGVVLLSYQPSGRK